MSSVLDGGRGRSPSSLSSLYSLSSSPSSPSLSRSSSSGSGSGYLGSGGTVRLEIQWKKVFAAHSKDYETKVNLKLGGVCLSLINGSKAQEIMYLELHCLELKYYRTFEHSQRVYFYLHHFQGEWKGGEGGWVLL